MSHLALPVQRAPRNPEEAGGPALVSAREPQDALDVAVLEGAQVRDLVFPERRRRLGKPQARLGQPLEIFPPDRSALRERRRALEEIFELADVAGEIVAQDGGVGVAVQAGRRPAL